MTDDARPVVDDRSTDEIRADATALVPYYTEQWRPQEGDVGTALLGLFADLAGGVVDRLNQVPQNQFVAFLDELGFSRRPPQAARAPVMVTVTEGAPENAAVPTGTTVLAPATDDRAEQAFVVPAAFEATPARLQHVVGVVPRADRLFDHTAATAEQVPLFEGRDVQEHAFSLAHDELLTLEAGATVVVTFDRPTPDALASNLVWTYYGVEMRGEEEVEGWHPLACTVDREEGRTLVYLTVPGEPSQTTVGDVESRWLRCRANPNVAPSAFFGLTFEDVRLGVSSSRATGADPTPLEPDRLFANDVALDPSPAGGDLLPFGDLPRPLDAFYIASDEAFSKHGATVTLRFAAATSEGETDGGSNDLSDESEEPTVSWEYWDGNGWTLIETAEAASGGVDAGADPSSLSFLGAATDPDAGPYDYSFEVPRDIEPTTVSGHEHHWIRARLVGGGYGSVTYTRTGSDTVGTWTLGTDTPVPRFGGLTVQYSVDRRPTHLFTHNHGETGSDLAADRIERFRPFRPLPDADQTLYLGFDAPLDDGPIPLFFGVRDTAYEVGFHPRIRWERLVASEGDEDAGETWAELGSRDGTESLTERGVVDLSLTEPTVASRRFGHERHWIRARVDGDPFVTAPSLARPERFDLRLSEPVVDDGLERFNLVNRAAEPVDLTGYRLTFGTATALLPVGTVLAGGESVVVGVTVDAAGPLDVALALTEPVVGVSTVDLAPPCGDPVAQLDLRASAADDAEFDTDREHTETAGGETDTAERCGPCGPPTGARVVPPGCERLLPSVSPIGEPVRTPPTLAVYPNTGWAVARRTVTDEFLGSSDGTADQTFAVSAPPVLSGVVEVNELQTLPRSDRETLVSDGVAELVTSGDGTVTAVWVTWTQVEDFLGSGPDDRHVTVDATTGEVAFGDGARGMIPPRGETNIRVSYETGGGAASNVDRGALTDLTSSLPFVDGVTNPEAADGGADAESTEAVLERGPRELRDRNRAVTAADFERVALAASRSLARVRCLTGMDDAGEYTPGWVTVLVVPRAATARPTPSAELVERVKGELAAHAPLTLVAGDRLVVRGPSYVEVSVAATLVARPGARLSALEDAALAAVTSYLHPLDGREGEGWDFGALPCLSDWYALLEATDGVDYVTDLSVTFASGDDDVTVGDGERIPRVAADVLVCSGAHRLVGSPPPTGATVPTTSPSGGD